jgi:hypothetical protein
MNVFLAGTSGDFANDLDREFETVRRVSACVAWASTHHDVYNALQKNKKAIGKLVVGTHFYQTEPAFIREFQKHPGARFVFSGDEMFHPKLYLFEHKNGRRSLFVGSSNFTWGGLGGNIEANVKVVFKKGEKHPCLTRAEEFIDDSWNRARRASDTLLGKYEAQWKKREAHRHALGIARGKRKKVTKAIEDVKEANWSWSEFVKKVGRFRAGDRLQDRLNLLEKAQRLFKIHRFAEMTPQQRRCLAGTIRASEPDSEWQAFGTMPVGFFEQAVKDKKKAAGLSWALEKIPRTGDISSERFSDFVQAFRKAAPPKTGIGCATRLLAMRRPDYFFCLNGPNERLFKKAFGIKGTIELEDYWSEVVERVKRTPWWDEKEPTAALEKRIWRCRAALMDNIFYN